MTERLRLLSSVLENLPVPAYACGTAISPTVVICR
jgi:hypothetical protein